MQYVRRWSNSQFATHFFNALQHPPACCPDGDWVNAVADTARILGVVDDVHCGTDIPPPEFYPPPSWTPLINTKESVHPRPKVLLHSLLRQKALEVIAIPRNPCDRLYFTNGSAGPNRSIGAACICGEPTTAYCLPNHVSAFQAELVAILLALQYTHQTLQAKFTSILIFFQHSEQ